MLKNISLTLVFLVALVFASTAGAASDPIGINIIPKPVKAELKKGTFSITGTTIIKVNTNKAEVLKVAADFKDRINKAKHYNIQMMSAREMAATLDNEIRFYITDEKKKYGKEGYSIDISPQGIIIKAHEANGLFYAVQSIYQLLPAPISTQKAIGSIALEMPCAYIFDKPRFGWRGNMLDPSRHFISTDFIKQNLDYLASLKMNVFHWHLTDDQGWRIEIKSFPKLTEIGAWRVDRNDEQWGSREAQQPGEIATYGGFYTQEQIKEIIAYANERYITIIPEVDIPGHSRAAIAAHPEISCDGGPYFVATGGIAKDNTYCPGKEKTFEFTEIMLKEVMSLFPAKYMHIGGDECNKEAWKVCADCQKRIKEQQLKDEFELQSYFIKRVEKIINSAGKKMIGWDEILEGGLAPNATVMSWRGEAGGITAAKSGHDVVMSPNSYCYLDLKQGDPDLEPDYGYGRLLLTTTYSYNPIPEQLSEKEAKHILGIQGNLWGESMQTAFDLNYMLFPRLFAVAEVAWSPQELRDFDDFVLRLNPAFERLEAMGVNYARSAYNVTIATNTDESNNKIQAKLSAEIYENIRYTTDGSKPTVESPLYKKPFYISGTTTIKARSFIKGNPAGNISEKTIKIHKAAGKQIKLVHAPSKKYDAGKYGLTDCLNGGLEFADGTWMGFNEKDLNGVIDLEEQTTVNSISVSFMHNTNPWIFLPTEVIISTSTDGKKFEQVKVFDTEKEANKGGRYLKIYSANTDQKPIRYIKIHAKNIGTCPDWHPAKGGKAWLFVDEIVVE